MPLGTVTKRRLLVAALVGCTFGSAAAAVPLGGTLVTRGGDRIPLVMSGKWLLINYWATWCEACRKEAPVLAALARQGSITVLGLSNETIDSARFAGWVAAHPFPYRVALVNDRDLPSQIAPRAFFIPMRPISYLVRPDGFVARRFLGALDPGAVDDAIAKSGKP
jgi:thiol-disulfide isomerase/thioredoxin